MIKPLFFCLPVNQQESLIRAVKSKPGRMVNSFEQTMSSMLQHSHTFYDRVTFAGYVDCGYVYEKNPPDLRVRISACLHDALASKQVRDTYYPTDVFDI